MRKLIVGAAMLFSVSGCVRDNTSLLQGPPIAAVVTPYGAALSCLARVAGDEPNKPVVAVGAIADRTGKFSLDDGGYKVSQGPDLMVMSALAKTRAVRLVERVDTRVIEWELKYANDKILGDGPRMMETDKGPVEVPYRGIKAGVLKGSDYYLVGGITSIDYNIFSGGAQIGVNNIGPGFREYRLLLSIDLRLVDSRTSEVKQTSTLHKQVVGYEVTAGIFKFFGNTLIDLNLGAKKDEPVSLAVRAVVERSVFDLVTGLLDTPETAPCQELARQGELATTTANVVPPMTPADTINRSGS
jgi:curli biogenesis system outer membrane secretion channel CsgG